MCGIAGILREDVDLREREQLLCQMSDSLRSRGPDDSGRYLEPGRRYCTGGWRLLTRQVGGSPCALAI